MWIILTGCVGSRASIDVPVQAGPANAASFSASDGGEIALTEASVTFSDLRLEEPNTDGTEAFMSAWSPIASAYAHPGHDYPGDVAGELLGTFTLDLLGADVELGVAPCYEGEYATGRVAFEGTVATLTGTHTFSDVVRPFRFVIEADQQIMSIPFDVTLTADAPPARIDLGYDAAYAMSFVDWAEADVDGDGTLTVADGTYANTVKFGVVATPSFDLSIP